MPAVMRNSTTSPTRAWGAEQCVRRTRRGSDVDAGGLESGSRMCVAGYLADGGFGDAESDPGLTGTQGPCAQQWQCVSYFAHGDPGCGRCWFRGSYYAVDPEAVENLKKSEACKGFALASLFHVPGQGCIQRANGQWTQRN